MSVSSEWVSCGSSSVRGPAGLQPGTLRHLGTWGDHRVVSHDRDVVAVVEVGVVGPDPSASADPAPLVDDRPAHGRAGLDRHVVEQHGVAHACPGLDAYAGTEHAPLDAAGHHASRTEQAVDD